MAQETKYYRLIPYRDTAARIATEVSAEQLAAQAFKDASIGTSPRVRSGYWYDLQQAGATAYDGSNEITFASGSNKYGFPDMVQLAITVPQSKAYAIYGIADYSANPSLQAWEVNQRSVGYPLVYLSPDLYTNEDHKAILNGSLPAVKQNESLTITLYGVSDTIDNIDILFKVAETAAQA